MSVDANVLSGTATIVYDKERVALADITPFVADCSYQGRDEVLGVKIVTEAR